MRVELEGGKIYFKKIMRLRALEPTVHPDTKQDTLPLRVEVVRCRRRRDINDDVLEAPAPRRPALLTALLAVWHRRARGGAVQVDLALTPVQPRLVSTLELKI